MNAESAAPHPPWPRAPGTYALVLACRAQRRLRIGAGRVLTLRRGFCVYVGSAFGCGGLAARLQHHAVAARKPHWHIDFLRAQSRLLETWTTTRPKRWEHEWADALARMLGAEIPLPGFGSSDCGCLTHLVWFADRPQLADFSPGVASSAVARPFQPGPGTNR